MCAKDLGHSKIFCTVHAMQTTFMKYPNYFWYFRDCSASRASIYEIPQLVTRGMYFSGLVSE